MGAIRDCLYVPGFIEGIQVKFLYDTGATCSFVSLQVWEAMLANLPAEGLPEVEEPDRDFRTVTGQELRVIGKAQFQMVVDDRLVTGKAWIGNIMEEAILGIDFMKAHRCSWNWDKEGLVWGALASEGPRNGWNGERLEEEPANPFMEDRDPLWFLQQPMSPRDEDPTCWQVITPVDEWMFESGRSSGQLESVQPETEDLAHRIRRVKGSDGIEVPQEHEEPAGAARDTRTGIETDQTPTTHLEAMLTEAKDLIATLPDHLVKLYESSVENLDVPQQRYLKKVLGRFQGVFSKDDNDLGRTGLEKHRIPTGDARPVRLPPRRAPLHMRGTVDEQIQEMLTQGIVEPCSSPWAAPLVIVKKKDGSNRICVDYRGLNEVTEKDGHPLPRIEDSLDALAGATVFSTLDMTSGYYQVEVEPGDRDKTAFVTGRGHHLRFVTMPFGLCGAPSTFQRLMERVLQDLQWKTVVVYLDDVIVFSKTVEEHTQHLGEVLARFEEHNLKLKPRKCELFRPQVAFLGHVVSEQGVATNPDLVDKVQGWDPPRNQKEVRAFLGLSGYYRKYIPHYADVAEPLVRLTEARAVFKWTHQCQKAFEELKKRLTSAPILAYPAETGEFVLDADSSDVAAGAVLSQLQEGQEKVIAYGSKAFSAEERNYCVTRRELLAIVWAMETYRYYLYGKRFTVRTDHASLKWILKVKEPKDQLARWIQRLSVFDFVIEHRPGKKHGNADALSRKCFRGGPCFHPGETEATVAPGTRFTLEELRTEKDGEPPLLSPSEDKADSRPAAQLAATIEEDRESTQEEGEDDPPEPGGLAVGLSHQEILERQQQDPAISEIRERKLAGSGRLNKEELSATGEDTKWWNARWDALEVRDGLLYYRWEAKRPEESVRWRLATPKNMVNLVLSHLHDGKAAGHMGLHKTWGRAMKCPFYWPAMKWTVVRWIKRCQICQQRKNPPFSKRAPLVSHQVGIPWERIAADVAGPFPVTRRGNKYILVIQDYFSKWVEIFPMPNQTAETIATLLVDNVVARFGCCRELHTDQGSNFGSQLMKEVCRLLGIYKTRTTGYHPRGDGMVERFNRTMEAMLAAWTSSCQDDWDQHLALIGMAYRSAPHESTKETPNRMIFGREVTLPVDLLMEVPPGEESEDEPATYVENLQERLRIVHDAAREHLSTAMVTQKRHYDRNVRNIEYQIGDVVWLHYKPRKKGKSPKLARGWKGPYLITSKLSDVTYRIQVSPRSTPEVVHADRLKLCEGKVATDLGFKLIEDVEVREEEAMEPNDCGDPQEAEGLMEGFPSEVLSTEEATREIPALKDSPELRTTRGGRVIRPPKRYQDYM